MKKQRNIGLPLRSDSFFGLTDIIQLTSDCPKYSGLCGLLWRSVGRNHQKWTSVGRCARSVGTRHQIDVRHVQDWRGGLAALQQAVNCSPAQYRSLPERWRLPSNYVLHWGRYFGLWVFEERCALAQVGDQSQTCNQLAPQARFQTRAFEKCRTLQQLNIERTER